MPSQKKVFLQVVYWLFVLNILLWLINEQQWHEWQIFLSVFCVISYRYVYRFWQVLTARFIDKNELLIERFVLSENGICQFADICQQLSARSQINPLGYWLIFQKPLLRTNVSRVFIFNDSLSKQDNARIARVIRKLRHHQQAKTN